MFVRQLRTDLKKNIISLNFLLGSAALFLIVIFGNFTVDPGKEIPPYSLPQLLIKTDREYWLHSYLYSGIMIFLRGFQNQWLAVLLPAAAGIACVPMLCDEINSGNYRFLISRCGRHNYIMSKFLSCMITTVLMIFISFSIFAIICVLVFPSPSLYLDSEALSSNTDPAAAEYLRHIFSFEQYPICKLLHSNSTFLVIVSRILTASIFSIVPCIISMIISAFTVNKFVSISLPVMLYFAITQIMSDILEKKYIEGKMHPFLQFFDPRSRLNDIETWFSEATGAPTLVLYAYPLIVSVALYFVFSILMNRKVRC